MLLQRAQYKQRRCLLLASGGARRATRTDAPQNNPQIHRGAAPGLDLGSNFRGAIRTKDAVAASQNASVKAYKKRGSGISGRLGAGHVLLYFFTSGVVSFKNCQRTEDLCNLVIAAGFELNLAIVKPL